MKLTFDIVHRGDPSAGQVAYEEEVTVSVKWDVMGDHTEFAEEIRRALLNFYDGAQVSCNFEKNYAKIS